MADTEAVGRGGFNSSGDRGLTVHKHGDREPASTVVDRRESQPWVLFGVGTAAAAQT
jgi:hypothetical protein